VDGVGDAIDPVDRDHRIRCLGADRRAGGAHRDPHVGECEPRDPTEGEERLDELSHTNHVIEAGVAVLPEPGVAVLARRVQIIRIW
jgi:hypothetical protein